MSNCDAKEKNIESLENIDFSLSIAPRRPNPPSNFLDGSRKFTKIYPKVHKMSLKLAENPSKMHSKSTPNR